MKATGKIAYKTAAFTVRTVIKTVRFTINTLVNIVAFATNPVVLIIAAILILIVIMGAAFILLLGGGSFGSSTNGKAQAGAVGLGDVVTEYDLGKEYFRIAVENSQSNFNSLIDSLYYDYGDLTNSDVIYMERYKDDGNTVIYNRSFPTDYQKEVLKNSWSIALSEKEALAIAYVYLEKQLNDSSNTTRQIYEVTYNQDVFDEILDTCIKFTDNTYNNQACPDLVCTAHYIHNDDYDTAWTNQQGSVNAYNEWGGIMDYIAEWYTIPDGASQSQYWTNNVEWRINNWWYVYSYLVDYYPDSSNQGWDYLDYLGGVCNYYSDILDNTPEYFIEQGCDYVHTLHSVGLTSYSVDDILTALGFDDAYTQWYELTLKGFESNPELS